MEILIFFLGAGFGAALGIFMLALVSVNDARRPASHKRRRVLVIKPRFSQAELKLAAVVGMTLNHTAGILLANGTIREIMLLAGVSRCPFLPASLQTVLSIQRTEENTYSDLGSRRSFPILPFRSLLERHIWYRVQFLRFFLRSLPFVRFIWTTCPVR